MKILNVSIETACGKNLICKSLVYFILHSVFSFAIINSSYSQDSKIKYFDVLNDIPIVKSTIEGDIINHHQFITPEKTKFILVSAKNSDTVIVRFLHWRSNPNIIRAYRDSVIFTVGNDSIRGNEYYLMKKSDLDNNCAQISFRGLHAISFAVGFVTMPVKLRVGKNFDFEPTISLGTTAGLRMRMSRHYTNYINFLVGASTSTINLDSSSARGIKTGESLKNVFVFSPSFGIVVEFSKSQIGLFCGYDLLGHSNKLKHDWIYQKKPWISIGFGFSIFKTEG